MKFYRMISVEKTSVFGNFMFWDASSSFSIHFYRFSFINAMSIEFDNLTVTISPSSGGVIKNPENLS